MNFVLLLSARRPNRLICSAKLHRMAFRRRMPNTTKGTLTSRSRDNWCCGSAGNGTRPKPHLTHRSQGSWHWPRSSTSAWADGMSDEPDFGPVDAQERAYYMRQIAL